MIFPTNPVLNQTHYDGSKYWVWNGRAWRVENVVDLDLIKIKGLDAGNADSTDTVVKSESSKRSEFIGTILSGAIFKDGYTEGIFTVKGVSPKLSPTNGSIQLWALTANATPTTGIWESGQSITLLVNDTNSAYTISWASMPITWLDSAVPVLSPNDGYTFIVLAKIGNTIYGNSIGQAL
jgi:hypothetical protein